MLVTVIPTYAILEIAARKLPLPDRALIGDIEREIAERGRNPTYFDWIAPLYGWDNNLVKAPSSNSSKTARPLTIIFIGDSVTRGFGVDVHNEAYPMLLGKQLDETVPVEVLNAAVPGFGVDQMVLKLEKLLPENRPDLIVFAYIPHDLWRPARDVNYGYPKPVLQPDDSEDGMASRNWAVKPALSVIEFYRNYLDAKQGYYLGLWSLNHILNNRRYYFSCLYNKYYEDLYEEIRDRLIKLADQHDAEVLVIRLASTWPGRPVPFLDRRGKLILSRQSSTPRYHYFDSQECVQAKSRAVGIDYDHEFKYHPGPKGHEIYSHCLIDSIRTISVMLQSKGAHR